MLPGKQLEYTIAASTTHSIQAEGAFTHVRVKGTATITGNYILQNTGLVYTAGSVVYVEYVGVGTYNGGTISLLGKTLTQQEAKSKLFLIYIGNGTDFDLFACIDSTNFQERIKGYETQTVDLNGNDLTLDLAKNKDVQVVSGTGTLNADWEIGAGTGKEGDIIKVFYNGGVTPGAFGITIFGKALSSDEITNGGVEVVGINTGSVWTGYKLPTITLDKATQSDAETGTDNIDYVTSLRVAQKLAHWLLNGNKTTSVNWTFGGTLNLSALTASRILELDGSKNIISAAKATGYNLALGSSAGTIMEGNDSRSLYTPRDIPVSFETSEQGNLDIVIEKAGTLSKVQIIVRKTLAGTDDGTVALYKGASAMAGGSQTVTASTVFGTSYTLTPTTNNTFAVSDTLRITTSKTTAGGKLLVILHFTNT